VTIVAIVGAGVMGSALCFPLVDNGHDVRLIGTHLDEEIIKSIRIRGYHPRLKRPMPDVSEKFQVLQHTDMAAIQGAQIVVLGVNSQGVHWVAEKIGPHLQAGQILLMVTKGLESTADGHLMILPDVLHARLPANIRDQVVYAAVGGPSIAGELAARRHTSVVFTSRNANVLPLLQTTFATPYYHIWASQDIIGVEVCVALKNPYALAVGLAQGVLEKIPTTDVAGAKNHNYAAAIFAQGLAEMAYLVQHLGGGLQTVFSLPGAGDLYVTTQGGRNSRMGRLLGMGLKYSEAVEEMPDETVEGIDAVIAMTPAVEAMISRGEITPEALPLLRALHEIVARGATVDFAFKSFFSTMPFLPPLTATQTLQA
jgi:glycerol-3-phosphate dehydrogenase (NAD(P)+)